MDRNSRNNGKIKQSNKVALRKESVDRNPMGVDAGCIAGLSLSARRAWIEIGTAKGVQGQLRVALRKESVDRNLPA